jgi:glycosyltransferase involved in cell wall biosynthesis
MPPRALTAVMFSPRGGSAPVARALAVGLRARGYEVTLVAGSRADLGSHGDARCFYGDVHPVSFDAALATEAPLRYEGSPGTAPIHPSFEERRGAPDRVFAMLDDLDYERQVRSWGRELVRAGAGRADVLHLHHLTPLNEAAARVAPGVPIVGQLHGTELLMLEQIASGPPPGWDYAERWAERLRAWAAACSRLLVAPGGSERAANLLEVPRELLIELGNGVDLDRFAPREIDRAKFWRRQLVAEPQGWLPGEPPGSARYSEAEVAPLASEPVLLYVGRFTAVKRLPRLIEAFAQARARSGREASLVLVGGHPGEWEDEHPADTVARLGVPGVFLGGWHAYEKLPDFFSAADAVVSAAEREQFGQLLIEGMACELPAVAIRSHGPASIIESGRTGWLAELPDPGALGAAIEAVIEHPQERRRRGAAAREAVRARFSWPEICAELDSVLKAAIAATDHRDGPGSRSAVPAGED